MHMHGNIQATKLFMNMELNIGRELTFLILSLAMFHHLQLDGKNNIVQYYELWRNLMKNIKKILLTTYIVIMFLCDVFFVPVAQVWGPDKNIMSLKYKPLWDLTEQNSTMNGFIIINELCLDRIIIQTIIITLLTFSFYLLFLSNDKIGIKYNES